MVAAVEGDILFLRKAGCLRVCVVVVAVVVVKKRLILVEMKKRRDHTGYLNVF